MKRKVLLGLFIVMLCSFSVLAADFTSVLNQLDALKGQELTGGIGTLFGDQKVNVYLKTASGEAVVFAIQTKSKKVETVVSEELKDPTLKVYADEATVLRIYTSPQPLEELKVALGQGKITYEPIGFLNKIKFRVVKLFISFPTEGLKVESSETLVESKADAVEKSSDNTIVEKNPQPMVEKDISGDTKDVPAVTEEKVKDKTPVETKESSSAAQTAHVVSMTSGGFNPEEITVKSGEKVTWVNNRDGKISKAMVIGTQKCAKVKSGFFNVSQSYSYTFTEKGKCVIVDGILTTEMMNVYVE